MRALLLACALLVAACGTTGGLPRQPFPDIAVPAEWVAYSQAWVMIQTPGVTAAKLVYFTQASVDTALGEARALMAGNGWSETGSRRFVNPDRFNGVWAEFGKGPDTCRVTIIEGSGATHADLTIARHAGSRPAPR